MESKAWNWDAVDDDYWRNVSDEFLPTILRWKEWKFRKVLDLGCGIGRHSIFLAGCGFEVDAFDLSESGLEQLKIEAEKQKLDINITAGDMLELPYKDKSFDGIVAFHAIYHTDYKGLEKVISEIHRVLKENGGLYLTLNSKEGHAWKIHAARRIDDYTLLKTEGPEIDVPHTYLSYEDVLQVLKKFRINKIQQIFDYWGDRKHAHFFIECSKN